MALSQLLPVPPFGAVAASAATAESHAGCTTSCGNISIPYPFGVEPGCYHDGGFNLTCDKSYHPPKLFLGDGTVQVLDISIPDGTVRINSSKVDFQLGTDATWAAGGLGYAGPYFLADAWNNLLVVGCDALVTFLGENRRIFSACASSCLDSTEVGFDDVNYGRCQVLIPEGRASYRIKLQQLNVSSSKNTDGVGVFIVDLSFNLTDFHLHSSPLTIPAMLAWTINSSTCHENRSSPSCRSNHSFCQNYTNGPRDGHNCQCSDGYQGNPYISNGCRDVDECAHLESNSCYGICINLPGTFHCRCPDGTYDDPSIKGRCVIIKNSFAGLHIGLVVVGGSTLLLLALCAPFITRKIKLRRATKLKKRFFKQNHGLLLQQLISQKTDFGERMIIPLWDLEKATHNFDRTREAGGGGHGVVYKGILDLQVVAVKKSKIVVQREIDDFINEVAILSQINHRNVVKLIGCCLETEVPLLVYEFISNGTLDHHLHVEGPISLSWDDRIRIGLEVARALSYLHSAASMPIYHRDIKSSNILLDDNLTAKVSDFGASRYIPIDQTGVTTAVQGTIGYLDPMYYYTGRLTDKSDVFSFGVLLVELLTRKKPFLYRSSDGVGLVSHFVSLLKEGNLIEIIDPEVMGEDGEVQQAAALAALCTNLKGEDRPTMREVEMALENLRATMRHAPRDTTSRRCDGDHYMSTDGVTKEASRQYTMEEEILLSARYPR